MDPEIWRDLPRELGTAFLQTGQMVGIALAATVLLGLPLGILLFVTDRGLLLENRWVRLAGGFLVNLIRSTPFVILLVVLLPLTQILVGTTIGPGAAAVPLSVAAVAFYARLAEGSLREIDPGVLEAAAAIGASPLRTITQVLIPEALPSLVRGLTVTAISLIGFSAMAGIVGGGGIGDLAIRFGYYRYQTEVMVVTVLVLIVLVNAVQWIGDRIAARLE